jgi:sec-independent protein translocase protein TatA
MLLVGLSLFLNLGAGEIFIIVLVIVMLFGADKLPEITRTLGRSMREMKNAAGEIQRELETSAAEVKREMNIQEHIEELKTATDRMVNDVEEGIHAESTTHPTDESNTANESVEPNTENIAEEVKLPTPNPDTEDPLVPPDAIMRN